jgi:hypothetical protein
MFVNLSLTVVPRSVIHNAKTLVLQHLRLQERNANRGVHSVGSGYGPVAGSCEDGDEPSGFDATD